MRRAIAAARELAALNQACALLPDPSVLVNTIPILEAHDSSEIENIVTTRDELFRLASREDARADPQVKEAYRYRTALKAGFEGIRERPLTSDTALRLGSILLDREVDLREEPGTFIGNRLTGKPVYTPPESKSLLRRLLHNWEAYLHADTGPDPLIRMAVLHYQFEAIHPFADGNGRTGRLLNILYLAERKLLTLPVLYLSRYILRTRADYYTLINEVTSRQQWEDWVIYMLNGIEDTARWTLSRIDAVRDLMKETAGKIRREAPRIYSRELVDILFNQPYCRIAHVVDAGIVERQTASVYLKKLAKLGILREEKSGRENLYIHPALLQILKED